MSVGYEHIDLQACQEKGVSVTNTPNVSTDSVAELTVSLVLLTARRLLEGVLLRKLDDSGHFMLYLPRLDEELCITIKENDQILKLRYYYIFFT